MSFSVDEMTVLMIAAEGEPMIPIGRWKQACESLVARGLLKPTPDEFRDPTGGANLRITEAGKAAAGKANQEVEDAQTDFAKALITVHNSKVVMQGAITQAAASIMAATEAAMEGTGDSFEKAQRQVLTLLKEKLKQDYQARGEQS